MPGGRGVDIGPSSGRLEPPGLVLPPRPPTRAGLSDLLLPPVLDRNRLADLKVLQGILRLDGANPRPLGLFQRIRATLRSAGIDDLSALGTFELDGSQSWTGGQLLRPDRPTVAMRERLVGVANHELTNPRPVGRRVRAVRALTSTAAPISLDEFWVAADELTLRAGLSAIVHVPGCVVLVANRIVVEPGASITWQPNWQGIALKAADFEDPGAGGDGNDGNPGTGTTHSSSGPPPSKKGGQGFPGHQGNTGVDGPDAPGLVIIAGEMHRLPAIDLRGFTGGKGGKGGKGGTGGPGAKGEPAECGAFGFRNKGRGWGGAGGKGGPAGSGGVGGKGGDGGGVEIFCPEVVRDAITSATIDLQLAPGEGGDGGAVGKPGRGGLGGNQGNDNCVGWGPDGRSGPDGETGDVPSVEPASLRGEDGDRHGVLNINVVPLSQIQAAFSQPAIVRLDPGACFPGDAVTLLGANIPVDCRVRLGLGMRIVDLARSDEVSGTFVVPANIAGGMLSVELVDSDGAVVSNRAAIAVRPRLDAIVGAARWGGTLEIRGGGIANGASLRLGTALYALTKSGSRWFVTLPMPGGPFEQPSEDREATLVNSDGRESEPQTLHFEHWLHLGFDATANGFAFNNEGSELASVPNDIFDLDLFEETFGEDDMDLLTPDDIQAIVADTMDPAQTGAGWLFFGAYREYLKGQHGICTAWSAFALDAYLDGGTELRTRYSTITQVARELFALQGRVLSKEIIDLGISTTILGTPSNARFLLELQNALRGLVATRAPEFVKAYPLATFMPAAAGTLEEYWNKVSAQHTILPYAIRYPEPGETFHARVYCCSNWQQRHARIEFTKRPDGELDFVTQELNSGDPLDASANYIDLTSGSQVYRSSSNWLIGGLPMSLAMYDDVDLPTRIFALLCPVKAKLKAGRHSFGARAGDMFRHPDVLAPVPWLKNIVRIGSVDTLEVKVTGLKGGRYSAGIIDHGLGRSACAMNIATKNRQVDSLTLTLGNPAIRIEPGRKLTGVRLGTSLRTATGVRRAALENVEAGPRTPAGLLTNGNDVQREGAPTAHLVLGAESARGVRVTRRLEAPSPIVAPRRRGKAVAGDLPAAPRRDTWAAVERDLETTLASHPFGNAQPRVQAQVQPAVRSSRSQTRAARSSRASHKRQAQRKGSKR